MSKRTGRALIVVAALAGGYLLFTTSGVADQLDPDALARRLRDAGPAGIALFLIAFSLGELTQVPATVFFVTAMGVYGLATGLVLAAVGASVACTFAFLVVRVTGRWVLETRSLEFFTHYAPYIETQPVRAVVFLRLIFGASPPVNWALALTPISIRDFLVGTVVGLTPNVAAYAWLIHEMAFNEEPDVPRWAALVLLVLMVVACAAAHRAMMRRFGKEVP